jgi:uncharacterized protein
VKIDVSNLDQEPLRFDEELQVDSDGLDAELVAAAVKVRLRGDVYPQGDLFTVSGRCEMRGQLACSRCLEPVRWSTSETFTVEYRRPAAAPSDEELGLDGDDLEVIFLEDEQLDLAALASEQVSLALPMRIVCDENCAGLCPQCGANRNADGACSCEPEVDPRWQALADLAGSPTKS